ncbi:MAG TPA: GNAT family N-acetyltransferase [Steroidobacteraceae bacterium]|nr:GNAT family N-acetyltransferase [Steroidobacteraceae bacterium]
MESSLPVRPATLADTEALVALVNSAYRGASSKVGWTTEADLLGGQRIDAAMLREQIDAPQSMILVHEADGEIVACVALERGEADCYLGMLTIRPGLQSAGLGSRLLAAAEQIAAERWRAGSIYMTVIEQRTELIGWYERRGYVRTGEYRPFPYGDPRYGLPKRPDLRFAVLRKSLGA